MPYTSEGPSKGKAGFIDMPKDVLGSLWWGSIRGLREHKERREKEAEERASWIFLFPKLLSSRLLEEGPA